MKTNNLNTFLSKLEDKMLNNNQESLIIQKSESNEFGAIGYNSSGCINGTATCQGSINDRKCSNGDCDNSINGRRCTITG